MSDQEVVLIIGAGQAGIQVADSLRAEKYCGRVVLLSDEASLPYQRPQLSKDFLLATEDSPALPLRGAEFFAERDVELRSGVRVQGVDTRARSITLEGGERLGYSQLVIATGTRARELPVPGAQLSGVHRVRTLEDAQGLRKELGVARRLVVVGAGFIGLEVAAVALKLGIEVTVLPGDQAPMARALSPQASEWFRNHHLCAGVRLAEGESAQAFEGEDRQVSGVLSGSGRHYPADLVVIGIGALPNVELLAGSDVAVGDGVIVDEYLRTNAQGVWALGDCAAFPLPGSSASATPQRIESVQNATDQGRLLARNLIAATEGRPLAAYTALPWFWSQQGSAKLQIAGVRPEGCAEPLILGDPTTGKFSLLSFNRFDELVAVESLNCPADHMAARKILAQTASLSRQLAESENFNLKAHSRAVPAAV